MIFKDQAQQLVARWECVRIINEVPTLAVHTAIALSHVPDVPDHVLKALDGLLDGEDDKVGRRIYDVLRYVRSLVEENYRLEAEC